MTDLDDLARLAQAATRHNPTAVYKLATATDPQTVLALIERVKRAEAVVAEASESLRRYADRDVAIGILSGYGTEGAP